MKRTAKRSTVKRRTYAGTLRVRPSDVVAELADMVHGATLGNMEWVKAEQVPFVHQPIIDTLCGTVAERLKSAYDFLARLEKINDRLLGGKLDGPSMGTSDPKAECNGQLSAIRNMLNELVSVERMIADEISRLETI